MTSLNSTENKLLQLIEGGSDEDVLKNLVSIQANAKPAMVPALIDRWRNTDNGELIGAIYNLLIDVKDEKVLPYLVNSILDDVNANYRAELISILWQTGFDLAPFLDDLITMALIGEYMITVEVSTVVENIETAVPQEVVNDAMFRIEEVVDRTEDEDLVNLLENLKELVHQLPTIA